MQTITAAKIDDQLSALATALVGLDAEAERLSLGAVSGDKKAVDALATVHAKIIQASTDRTVLTQARAAAAKVEAAAVDTKAEADRAAAMKQAQAHAGKIRMAAQRIDALADEFRALLTALGDDERSIRAALRKAGAAPADGRVGQKGIVRPRRDVQITQGADASACSHRQSAALRQAQMSHAGSMGPISSRSSIGYQVVVTSASGTSCAISFGP